MGNNYTRQSAADIVDGNVVEAGPINAEFNALQNFADGVTGHSHDGTVGEGPKISLTGSITGVLPVANGGTGGVNKLDATTAPSVTADGDHGYAVGSLWIDTTAKVAYICLDASSGAAVWQRYQPYHASLVSIAGLTTTADQMIYTTASNAYNTTALTPFARTILDDADASTAQSTLGISTFIKTLLDDADASTAQSTLGISTYAKTLIDDPNAATARTTLGLGTIATQDSASVSITGGTLSGVTIIGGGSSGGTDLAVADGGTGASDATNARINLNAQTADAKLTSFSALTGSSDKIAYFTGATTMATTDFTAAGRALVDDADATAQRTTLGLGNVNNTSDANKPVSIATAAAITTAITDTSNIWSIRCGIGQVYMVDTSKTGAEIPPSGTTGPVFVELTAGLSSSGGQYNFGKLTGESVSGSAPLVLATAQISFGSSPMNGQTIDLLNSEQRMLRPGTSAGTKQNDQMQQITGQFSIARGASALEMTANYSGAISAGTTGSAREVFSSSGSQAGRIIGFDSADSSGARVGTETRAKNVTVKAYLRIA